MQTSTTSPLRGPHALINAADVAMRTLFAPAHASRNTPAADCPPVTLSDAEKQAVGALMRVNHTGEICAQALYSGQALASKNDALKQHLAQAAAEEVDHLAWTEQRLQELGQSTSILNPLWYLGAFAIGYSAARLGDDWSLGFVAETENQVEAHLQSHLDKLPAHDRASREIVAQMKVEEARHSQDAIEHGARALPAPVRLAMKIAAKVMTTTAARI